LVCACFYLNRLSQFCPLHQNEFVCVVNLQNYIFFGSVTGVQETIFELLRLEQELPQYKRLHYLIFNFKHIKGMDGAGVAMFCKIARRVKAMGGMQIVFSELNDHEYQAMHAENLVGETSSHMYFTNGNLAVEYVEKSLLKWASKVFFSFESKLAYNCFFSCLSLSISVCLSVCCPSLSFVFSFLSFFSIHFPSPPCFFLFSSLSAWVGTSPLVHSGQLQEGSGGAKLFRPQPRPDPG